MTSRLFHFTEQPCWTYSATPSPVLACYAQLPIPIPDGVNCTNVPQTTHDAAWWARQTKGLNFSEEDLNDPAVFNRIIWEGLMRNRPYPTKRSGAVMRQAATPQPETKKVSTNVGSK